MAADEPKPFQDVEAGQAERRSIEVAPIVGLTHRHRPAAAAGTTAEEPAAAPTGSSDKAGGAASNNASEEAPAGGSDKAGGEASDNASEEAPATVNPATYGEIVKYFGILGWTAFGGPAAHIGMFQKLFVEKLRWCTYLVFTELLMLGQCMPGALVKGRGGLWRGSAGVGRGRRADAGAVHARCAAWEAQAAALRWGEGRGACSGGACAWRRSAGGAAGRALQARGHPLLCPAPGLGTSPAATSLPLPQAPPPPRWALPSVC